MIYINEVVKEVGTLKSALVNINKAVLTFLRGNSTGMQLKEEIAKNMAIINSGTVFITKHRGSEIAISHEKYGAYGSDAQFQVATWPSLQKDIALVPALLKKIEQKPDKQSVLKVWNGGIFSTGLHWRITHAIEMINVTLKW